MDKGDIIIFEIHPKFGGYYTHVERTFCLGEPERRYLDIYDRVPGAYRARPRAVQASGAKADLGRDGRVCARPSSRRRASACARPAFTAMGSPRSNTRATATTRWAPTQAALKSHRRRVQDRAWCSR